MGPVGDGLPYTPPEIGNVDGVITNLTCVYDYSCPIDIMNETSCDGFNGIAVLTCLTCKSKHSKLMVLINFVCVDNFIDYRVTSLNQ